MLCPGKICKGGGGQDRADREVGPEHTPIPHVHLQFLLPSLTVIVTRQPNHLRVGGWGVRGGGAMRQRILGLHTPPCHRRMVITTLSSMFCVAALQRKLYQCRMLPCVRHSEWLSKVLRLFGSARSHHPPTAPVAPVSLKPLALWASLSLCFSSPSQGGMSSSSPSQGGFSSSAAYPRVSLCPSLPLVSASSYPPRGRGGGGCQDPPPLGDADVRTKNCGGGRLSQKSLRDVG